MLFYNAPSNNFLDTMKYVVLQCVPSTMRHDRVSMGGIGIGKTKVFSEEGESEESNETH